MTDDRSDDGPSTPSVPDRGPGEHDTDEAADAGGGPATNTSRDGVDAPANVPPGDQAASPGQGQTGGGPGAGDGSGGVRGGPGAGGPQRGPGEKFCSNCGSVIDQQAVVCPECGVEQAAPQRQQGNDAGIAALLAAVGFVVPLLAGAGQFYNGDIGKGIVFTLIQLLNVGLAFLLVGLLTYPLVAIVAVWDAYSSANR